MKTTAVLLALLLCMSTVAAIDLTALAKNSGSLHINKNMQTKIETALGIDFSKMTGVQSNSVTVTINNYYQVGSIIILIATINRNQYTIIVPTRIITEYIK
jgi:hypothetical protein